MKVVSTTYEFKKGDWVYRITTGTGIGTRIKRTNKENPLWGHGVLVQGYSMPLGGFYPINAIQHIVFDTVEEALAVIPNE